MKYLFRDWHRLKGDLAAKFILLFLDYDGTLSPIVRTPDQTVLPSRTKDLLRRLSLLPGCKIAVISGRAIKDLRRKVGIKGIIYVGNHGLELEGQKIKFRAFVSAAYKTILKRIKYELQKRLAGIKGVLIEDKGLSLSIHYRLVDTRHLPRLKTIFDETTLNFATGNKIKVREGKKVLEIRPAIEWDKGKIVLWLLSRHIFVANAKNILPVYMGDDLTDEDAFKALAEKGITVFIGRPKRSSARYFLKNSDEVSRFLRIILEVKTGESLCLN